MESLACPECAGNNNYIAAANPDVPRVAEVVVSWFGNSRDLIGCLTSVRNLRIYIRFGHAARKCWLAPS